ncbi:hypothetical protein F383_16396 [Gossypium arboreum]|uniref:Uncharacterized protein n=1 Tax=Gossypium arboreum TaxID=29729 RepID=A0A0B0PN16_GOSAR|nr:hypothetical protein F383_16396 [Gossypium arboreum]
MRPINSVYVVACA